MRLAIRIPRIRLDYDIFFTILYLVGFGIRFLTNIATSISGIFYFFCGCCIFCYVYSMSSSNRKLMNIVLIVTFNAILNSLLNGNNTMVDVLYVFSAQAFGFLISKEKEDLKFLKSCLMIVFYYIAVRVCFFPGRDIYGDISISHLCGKNSITIIMLFCYAINLVYREKNNLKFDYFGIIVGIFISLIVDSSGGILGFSLVGIGAFCCKNRNKIAWKRILILGTVVITILYEFGYFIKVFEFLSDDNSRFTIWEMYISLATNDIKSFLFGANISKNATLYRFFNIHNTVLNWHCFMGLIPMVFYSYVWIFLGIKCVELKKWYIFIIWGVMVVRSLTDGTDFCFMSFWIYMLCYVFSKEFYGKKR